MYIYIAHSQFIATEVLCEQCMQNLIIYHAHAHMGVAILDKHTYMARAIFNYIACIQMWGSNTR